MFYGCTILIFSSFLKIPKIERLNPGLKINVLGWSDGVVEAQDGAKPQPCVFPLYISKEPHDSNAVTLLLIGNELTSHYLLVTNLSGLLSKMTKANKAKYHCLTCLHG